MARVLIETGKRGWYADAANPDGGKVRRRDEDQIFDNIVDAQEALAVLEKSGNLDSGSNGDRAEAQPKNRSKTKVADKPKPEPKTTTAPTGKTLVGETVTIKCAWIEGGKNDGRPYETIKTKTRTIKGLTPSEQKKAHGKTRAIKPQDLFQARYCVEHQEENRKQRRREKARERTAARQKAKAKSAKS